jgi:hypothetical protein
MDILSFMKRLPEIRSGWTKAALGAAVFAAGIFVGWLLRGRAVPAASTESGTPASVTIPGTDMIVTIGHGTVGELLAMDPDLSTRGRPSAPGCFEEEDLRRTWQMDSSRVQWIGGDRRFEEGRLIDGSREGCWSFWYLDELFDSGRSGTYEKDMKVESAPSPLGDFGHGEPDLTRAPIRQGYRR